MLSHRINVLLHTGRCFLSVKKFSYDIIIFDILAPCEFLFNLEISGEWRVAALMLTMDVCTTLELFDLNRNLAAGSSKIGVKSLTELICL